MCRQMEQMGQVDHKLGQGCRFAVTAERGFQAIGLRWHVVDHDDCRGFGIGWCGPTAILLVRAALVDSRFDWRIDSLKMLPN